MQNIDEIILEDSTRGMDTLYHYSQKEFCKEAASAFYKLPKGVIFLYTGFYVAGFAETDGPLGTYFLAKALKKLDYEPIILTDTYCKDYFKEIETLYVPLEGLTQEEIMLLLHKYTPVAHISIERCGKNRDGFYSNARGDNISAFTAPLDDIFIQGEETFAIGDGGNEVGMGYFKNLIEEHLELIPSISTCKYPILSSVSNWGAYGFIAYLEKFTKQSLLPDFKNIDAYIDFILTKGCVDGIKKECVKSVDGKPWSSEKRILKALKKAITP